MSARWAQHLPPAASSARSFSSRPSWSVRPELIAENLSIFDFELTPEEVASIDALDTGVRGGPNQDEIDFLS
jgi:hypothetical protein